METSYLKTLELDKIIARAAEGCVCREAKAQMLALEPQCDPDEVRYSLEQTDAINSLLIKNGSPRFGGVEGVSQLVTRAVKGGVLSMGELLMVAGALRNFQNLSSWYGSSDHEALPTDDLFYALAPQPGLEQQISSAILAPDAMADTASRTLNELRKKIHATENSIRDRLETMVRNMDTSKYLQESVVSMRNGRYVVPVKSEYRGEVSGIIHDVSSTGATVFVEPQAVVEANARILQYRAQEAQEIERILVAFTAQVAAIEPQFQYSYKAMLEIDVLLAKARLALDMKAFKPAVRTDSSFSLIRARHPLIDPKKCVPVDIALGRDYDSLIITGPNTGGKTVTLKTAGLLCAMAQCGFLIPADERSEICVFDEFLVDIGDEQSIEQSLSTFSGHMKKITGILELAMPRTLVLLDELGAGTDPAEGAALAVAIIEELRRRGVLLMATTHYAELKVFALETKGVVNASCEFDLETLRPTYKLSVGVPGKSNAFLISEKLGIPLDKIGITYNGWEHMKNVTPDESIFDKMPGVKKGEYFYALGSLAKHKNFKWIREVARRSPDKTFVVAGGKDLRAFGDDAEAKDTHNVFYPGYVSDAENAALMKHCKLFLHPAVFEGFGIPPLEALALGAPVALANATCLPELYGDTARYFDPYDYDVDLDALAAQPVAAPDEVLKKYSWDKTAEFWLHEMEKYAKQ